MSTANASHREMDLRRERFAELAWVMDAAIYYFICLEKSAPRLERVHERPRPMRETHDVPNGCVAQDVVAHEAAC
jgi:hypothetical protein